MARFGFPRLLALIVIGVLVGGCDLLNITTEDYELPFLRTGEQSYELVTHEHYKETTISMTYRNGTGDEVYISRCGEQLSPPALEKRVDGEWTLAYSPISKLCQSLPPVEIDEGSTYEYEFEIRAWTRPNTAPRLKVDQVEGTYRVNWRLEGSLDDEGAPVDPLPTEQRVSNTFTMTER